MEQYEKCCRTFFFFDHGVYLESVVGPTAEFHIAFLIVERKPRDIDLARTFEYAWRNENTTAVIVHNDVGCVRAVETFVSTKTQIIQRSRSLFTTFR